VRLACLVTNKSDLFCTRKDALPELLLGSGSKVLSDPDAVFVMLEPSRVPKFKVAWMVIVALAWFRNEARLSVITPPERLHVPTVDEHELKVTPAGCESVIITFLAS